MSFSRLQKILQSEILFDDLFWIDGVHNTCFCEGDSSIFKRKDLQMNVFFFPLVVVVVWLLLVKESRISVSDLSGV